MSKIITYFENYHNKIDNEDYDKYLEILSNTKKKIHILNNNLFNILIFDNKSIEFKKALIDLKNNIPTLKKIFFENNYDILHTDINTKKRTENNLEIINKLILEIMEEFDFLLTVEYNTLESVPIIKEQYLKYKKIYKILSKKESNIIKEINYIKFNMNSTLKIKFNKFIICIILAIIIRYWLGEVFNYNPLLCKIISLISTYIIFKNYNDKTLERSGFLIIICTVIGLYCYILSNDKIMSLILSSILGNILYIVIK